MEPRRDPDPEPEVYHDDGDFFNRETAMVLAYFLLYSTAMFTLPFAAFFGTRHVLSETFGMEGFPVTGWSVLSSVLTVNAVVLAYAYKGYCDDVDDRTVAPPQRSQLNVKQD